MNVALRLGRAHPIWVLVAVLTAAFNLRAGIVIVGPLIDEIRSDTGMSSALAGALTTIPFFCLGLFAFLGPPLVRRFGYRMVVLVALLLVAVGSLARAVAPTGVLMIVTTLPIGLGIALVGVTLPAVVKSQFPDRGGLVTGAYISFLSIGIITVGLGLVPLADAVGDWRGAFAISAIPPAAAATLWIRRDAFAEGGPAMSAAGSEVPPSAVAPAPAKLRDRIQPDRTALLLGLTCGLQSVAFAGMVSWGPAHFQEAGWSEHEAAMVLTAIGFYTIVAALTLLPASEGRDRRHWLLGAALALSVALLWIALAPTTMSWVWLTIFGLGSGGAFPLLLALVLDLADRPADAVRLTSWMLGLGYLIAGLTPVVIGALRDLTGGLELPVLLLAGAGFLSAALCLLIPPPHGGKSAAAPVAEDTGGLREAGAARRRLE
jgi:CP family cyanate transporter-like MFS transporter